MLTTIFRFFVVKIRPFSALLFERRRFAIAIFCIIVSAGFSNRDVHAWTFDGLVDRLDGPSRDDIEVSFLKWRISPLNRIKMHNLTITLKIRNKSSYYLNELTYRCSFFDAAGNRIAKHAEAFSRLGNPSVRPGGVVEWEFWFNNAVGRDEEVYSRECAISDIGGSK